MKRLAVLSFLALFGIGASASVLCPTVEDLAPCTCKPVASGLHIDCANFEEKDDIVRAFKALRNYELQTVHLDHLYITEVLPSDLFSGLSIEELRIENSELEFAAEGFLGLEESLKTLRISKSALKSHPHNTLTKLDKLVELNVKEFFFGNVTNQLLNGKVPNVQILILEDNGITGLESKAFAELQYLKKFSAAGNGVTAVARTMGPRPGLYMESIDFSRNKISEIPADGLADFPKLTTVIFNANNLKTVSEAVWSGVWEQLDTVNLFDNDIVCDEDLDWLKKVKWPRVVTGNCVLPNSLVGKSLREVYKPEE